MFYLKFLKKRGEQTQKNVFAHPGRKPNICSIKGLSKGYPKGQTAPHHEKQQIMTPVRYTFLLTAICFLSSFRPAQAQCDIQLNQVVTNVLCYGGNTGAVQLTPSNGMPPYDYLWSDGNTTQTIYNLVAGLYTCIVTDALGCTAVADALVQQPAQLTVNILGDQVLNCFTPVTTLTAEVTGGFPPYTYSWGNGSTATIPAPGFYVLTITDANGCTLQSNFTIIQDVIHPIACTDPSATLTCAITQMTINGACSSVGPQFTHSWTGPGIVSGGMTTTPEVNQPGIYTLTVLNTQNGCSSNASVAVTQDITSPIANAGPTVSIPCGGGGVWLSGSGGGIGPNFSYLWTGPGILIGEFTLNPLVVTPGTYTLLVTNTQNGCTSTASVVVTESSSGLCSDIVGRVLKDTTTNCLADPGEPGLAGWIVRAIGSTGVFYAVTDSVGEYRLFVKSADTYAIEAIAPSALWVNCGSNPLVAAPNAAETYTAADQLFQALLGCPYLVVDITSGNLRRCFDNNFFGVSYCNQGTETATDAYIIVTLDPLLSIVSSSIPRTDLGNGQIRFDVGDIGVGQCGSFNFRCLLDCSAAAGQTHCTEAHIYPDTLCIVPDVLWSGASLRIQSVCEADSVRFRIENVGFGNMPNALEYIVIEDQVMLMSAPVQLNVGEVATVSVPANGSTWRLEVEQEPFHPGQSAPAISVEGCTTSPVFSTGFVAQFPTDDADHFIDIDCRANTAAYDPNDKQGFPLGYGAQRYVKPGTPLEYLIRFQNTGNDTAFTVRLVDTLSAWLDPASFRPGASSHPYTWDLSGAGVLTFLYENILLPDSFVNEPASHGFVKFTIEHRADAPLETVIENTAHIYFDFNEAIITNTTQHRLGEQFVVVGLWQPKLERYAVRVSPNPLVDRAMLEVIGVKGNAPLRLQVFDLNGGLMLEERSANGIFQLNRGLLPAGVYAFNIEQAGKLVGAGKLVVK